MNEVRIKLVSNEPLVDYPVTKPEDVIVLMQTLIGDMANEYFTAVFLNSKNRPLNFLVAGIGNVKQSLMEPSTVIKGALLQNAPKLMLFHNHPSGEAKPSASDYAVTQKFILAAELNNLQILDHVIVTGNEYYSFAENKEMELSDQDYFNGLKELSQMTTDEYNKKYSFHMIDITNSFSVE